MLNRAKPYLNFQKIVNCISDADTSNEKYVGIFEKKFSDYINIPFCIAINQGRSALFLALKILKVSKGDEVIVQSLICQVVVDAILEVGAIPILVDSQIDDYNISPLEIKKKITSKTKAIIAAHLYGVPCNIEDILVIARENNCYLIEDCAHTLGAKYAGKNIGTFGDISFFSFNFDKPISTGDGGVLAINNKHLIEDARRIIDKYKRVSIIDDKKAVYNLLVQHILTQKDIYKNTLPIDFSKMILNKNQELFELVDELIKINSSEYEIQNAVVTYLENKRILSNKKSSLTANYFIKGIGLIKSRLKAPEMNKVDSEYILMNSVRALVGIIELETLDQINTIRNNNAKRFIDSLKDNNCYILPVIEKKKNPAFIRFTILNNTKYSLSHISTIAKNKGVELGNYNWPKPVHLIYPYSKILQYNRKDLNMSEYIAKNLINLPVHYYIDETDINNIITILRSFGNKKSEELKVYAE